ncbi:glycoside hydrolase [Streptomyces sp. A7024]|uniref:Glycoside hydrolase n=1 Tax=Streptomyces coryli TaxID=1128680 RepID=A0A6G4UBE8_9ACTN|nr:C40 family peptidase [Streptomyces coryli]NGN69332.1 glycoside hydrolase [Streptomyces coryli]
MAAHRKPRTRILASSGTAGRRTAVGMTAALASVTLLSQNAGADDKPSLSEVQKQVDELYHQAGVATQKYNQAKERTSTQRTTVNKQLDEVAERTQKLNDARRTLGSYAAAQYRNGGIGPEATLMLADDPQSYFEQNHLMDRLTGRQQEAVKDFRSQQTAANKKRAEATKSLETLTKSQEELRTSKATVQSKLSEARKLLSKLTAEEKARLAAIERAKEAEAKRKAEEAARKAEAERQAELERQKREEAQQEEDAGSDSGSGSGDSGSDSGSSTSQYDKVLAFAKAQLGEPYVWGATGPNSWDCSGFTQGAYKAAGISLPRTTYDQVNMGTKITNKSDLKPGDMVFFYEDVTHVGIYVGNGQMIHAPKPGANVRYESVDYMPFHSGARVL